MQQLQEPTQSNVDSLHNAKREVTRQFRKKRKLSESTIVELETDIKTKNIRDLYGGQQ
jgi:hypothetical protein